MNNLPRLGTEGLWHAVTAFYNSLRCHTLGGTEVCDLGLGFAGLMAEWNSYAKHANWGISPYWMIRVGHVSYPYIDTAKINCSPCCLHILNFTIETGTLHLKMKVIWKGFTFFIWFNAVYFISIFTAQSCTSHSQSSRFEGRSNKLFGLQYMCMLCFEGNLSEEKNGQVKLYMSSFKKNVMCETYTYSISGKKEVHESKCRSNVATLFKAIIITSFICMQVS